MKKNIILNGASSICIGIIILLNGGCSKEMQDQWTDAIVLDMGSPAVDGCGFVLKINNDIYYPINLGESFQVDNKEVKIQYNTLNEMHSCGFPHAELKYQKVTLTDIMER